jgi:hypothetical protein
MLLKDQYSVLFVWVLAQQVGLPCKSAPVLMAAGALSAERQILAAFHRSEACLIVEGVWMTALLGDLTSQPCEGAVMLSSRKKAPRRPTSRQQERSK